MSETFKKITAFCLLTILCVTFLPKKAYAVPDTSEVNTGALCTSAQAALLLDADSGAVLYAKNADERLPMASTTKIMTALVALGVGDLDAEYEIPHEAIGTEGSSVYLVDGERLTLRQLLYALMLESANDAAVAIAVIIAGDVAGFVAMMNAKAEELGLQNTHFVNPNGLDDDPHYTSARDLAILSAYALKDPGFREIVSTRKSTIPYNNGEGTRLLVNHNKMLRNYDGAIGVKTGYTKRSGRCLVSAAERNGLTLVAVTINAPDDWRDHTAMLDWGFEHFVRLTLADAGGFRVTAAVAGGVYDWTVLSNTEAVTVTLPAEHGEIRCYVEAPHFLLAPVASEATAGRVIYTAGGEVIGSSPLRATVNVEQKKPKKSFFRWLKRLFGSNGN